MHNNSLGRDLIPKGKRDFVIDVDFGEKVTWRRKNLQISQKELATVVGVSVNTIQSYEQGHLPRGSNFVTLAKILRCSMDWLGGLSDADERSGGPDEPPGFKAPRRLTVPPLLDLSDQARHPGQAACVFEYELLAQISSDPSNVSRLTIHGPTMAPTLLDGDLVLVDQGKTAILQGSLYALSFGGDSLIVNRLETRPGGVLRILSDNSEITPPYEVAINQVQIIGQIIWQSRTL